MPNSAPSVALDGATAPLTPAAGKPSFALAPHAPVGPTATPFPVGTVPAGSTPPIPPARGASTPPIPAAPAASLSAQLEAHPEYRPPPRSRLVIFGPSTLVFLLMCGFGYYKYQEYQNLPPPPPPKVTAAQAQLKDVPLSANPLDAIKKAKNTLDTAAAKQQAVALTVEQLTAGVHTAEGPASTNAAPPASTPTVTLVSSVATSGNTLPPAGPSANVYPETTPAPAPAGASAPTRAGGLPAMPAFTRPGSVTVNSSFPTSVASPLNYSNGGLEILSSAALPASNVVIATPTASAGPTPSVAFQLWAEKLKIGGLRLGEVARVFINRTAYHEGELVEPEIGIVFTGYDREKRLLRFTEKSGATIDIKHKN